VATGCHLTLPPLRVGHSRENRVTPSNVGGVQIWLTAAQGVEPIDPLPLSLALDLMFAGETGLDHPLHQSMRRFAHPHRVWFSECLQSRCEIDRVTENRNPGVGTTLDLSDNCRSRIEADPQLWAYAMSALYVASLGAQLL
jgi:hypothetical protein